MTRQNLLLLHGALGASAQFAPLIQILQEKYTLHTLDFEGHGRTPMQPRPFRIEHFAENVRAYLAQHSIERTHIFGYSMGGYVACTLAITHPHLVESIATLGTKFHWDPQTAEREVGFLNPEKIAAKVPHFARALAERHTASGWEAVVNKTSGLLTSLGEVGGLRAENLSQIACRVRVMVGDRDTTVGVPEAYEVYRALPQGELEVLPATRHELERVEVGRLVGSLVAYFLS
jgi:pimeloyl-ACP methyl ester carboxylesterase